jgi:hypothetical protein
VVTHDPWAEDAPIRRRNHGCLSAAAVLVVGALVVSAVASFVESIAVDITVVVVIAAVVIGLAIFFRGPPER